ncbi:MAG: DUF1254 domain-containing protein [Hyphomicrobiaceae bacterium]
MSWIFSRLKRMNWRVVIMALFCVGIIHITATLSAAQYGDHPGFKTLTENLPVNQIVVLPPVTPDQQPLAYMAPDTRYAVCRYDTTDGPVEVEVLLPDDTWTVALHTPKGENIFAASGQGNGAETLKIKLVPSPDRFTGLTPEARGTSQENPAELSVVTKRGVAIVRGPIKGLSYVRMIEENLRNVSCQIAPNES